MRIFLKQNTINNALAFYLSEISSQWLELDTDCDLPVLFCLGSQCAVRGRSRRRVGPVPEGDGR